MAESLTVYGIRHKPTGEFMPARMSRSSRGGWSWWREPNQKPYDPTPRLFPTAAGARNALTAWMQGRWVNEETTHGWEFPETEVCAVPEATEVPRVRADMEIVTFTLAEVAA